MPALLPFRGWRYDPDKAGPLDRLATPPYDVISPDERSRMAAASPYNLVHVTLPEDSGDQDRYQVAARRLREWRRTGALARDATACFTRHAQTYTAPHDSRRRTRTGLLGLLEMRDLAEGTVRPHERTLAGPRQDRTRLMQVTRSHLSPIFMIVSDADGAFDALLADGHGTQQTGYTDHDGIEHHVDRLADADFVRRVAALLADRPMLIADGHHRFESAAACHQALTQAPDVPDEIARESGRVLVEVVSSASPGLTVLPTHRLVKGIDGFLAEDFIGGVTDGTSPERLPEEGAGAAGALAERLGRDGPGSLGILTGRPLRAYVLRRTDLDGGAIDPESRLDVVYLHRTLLRDRLGIGDDAVEHGTQVSFVKDAAAAGEAVARGEAQIAFLLNATPMADLDAVTAAGKRMPQKSTYFYPKLPAGLVLHTFD